MKKLSPFAVYALAAVVTALGAGAGSVLAQNTTGQDMDADSQNTQLEQDTAHSSHMTTPGTKPTPATKPTPGVETTPGAATIPNEQSSERAKQVVSQTPAADRANKPDHATADLADKPDHDRMEHRGYVDTTPVNGVQASDLIGAEVKTLGGENVGPVDDLIIDENGQIVAILIGVGGFLNMGEKDVAIGWDDVTRTGDSDDQELTIDMTRDDLRPAPEFAKQD